MKISIITVCFNSAETIEDTLFSVAAQSYPEVEHIVVDGGSKDGTQGIVAHHGSCVTKFISEPDNGIYDAMNKGLDLASGHIIGFLNADDVYADNEVIAKVADIMSNGGLDALYGDAEFFHSDNPEYTVRRYSSQYFSHKRIAMGWMPAHPTLFLQRRVFERFGPFNTDYRIAGDFEFVARVFHADTLKYHYLPEVMVRMRTGGVSTGGWRNTLLLNWEVLHACRENGIPTNLVLILSKYPAKLLEFVRR